VSEVEAHALRLNQMISGAWITQGIYVAAELGLLVCLVHAAVMPHPWCRSFVSFVPIDLIFPVVMGIAATGSAQQRRARGPRLDCPAMPGEGPRRALPVGPRPPGRAVRRESLRRHLAPGIRAETRTTELRRSFGPCTMAPPVPTVLRRDDLPWTLPRPPSRRPSPRHGKRRGSLEGPGHCVPTRGVGPRSRLGAVWLREFDDERHAGSTR